MQALIFLNLNQFQTSELGRASRDLQNPLRAPATVPVVAGIVLVGHNGDGELAVAGGEDGDHSRGKVLRNVLLEGVIDGLPQGVLALRVGLGIRGHQAHVVKGEDLLGAGIHKVGGIDLVKGGNHDLFFEKKKKVEVE